MMTGKDSHGTAGGLEAWTAFTYVGDTRKIPLIADRTASPKSPFRTKVMHTSRGSKLIDAYHVLDVKQFGCQGQNETAVDGSGKWVDINLIKAHNIAQNLRGFWSRQY